MSKRKRNGIMEFDPNQSDSQDENFDPTTESHAREKKRSRPSQGKGRRKKRSTAYSGSDIENDDDEPDSDEEEASYDEGDFEEDEDEENAPVNASGRRTRKAASAAANYKEDSEDLEESDDELTQQSPKRKGRRAAPIAAADDDDDMDETAAEGSDAGAPQKRVITLKMPKRATRASTQEGEGDLVEFSNSGRHVNAVSRSSKSHSPDAAYGRRRSSRGSKGLKKHIDAIEEATQESGHDHSAADDRDELSGEPDVPADENVIEGATGQAATTDTGGAAAEDDDDDDDDDVPITNRRSTRSAKVVEDAAEAEAAENETKETRNSRRLTRRSGLRNAKSAQEPSSDFEPGEESPDDAGMSDASQKKGARDDVDMESPTPRGRRATRKSQSSRNSRRGAESEDEELDQDEMADELDELRADSRRPRRRPRRASPPIIYDASKRRRAAARPMNYYMPPLTAAPIEEEEGGAEDPAPTPARRRGRGGATVLWDRPLNTTFGPFGGGGGMGSVLTGPWGTGAAGGVDSDSSDDEMKDRSGAGNAPTTPTSAGPTAGLLPQQGGDVAGVGATPNVGKIKSQKALADADPLGVDLSVDFSKVGGLQGHIDQLKEMVQLPLLYPELFARFHVTPPRGVLFHGPPGTGKTLLARALANSMGVGGRKITFYMRKGADALSKWVGEAEKQLRLLFEEARRTQPSIIFFDEIDGLAPVRSSKQEQIHASIVSTLLALMDGMDGRGQVIVIGATNRPDNIDPALRRPGRFDREFYFPLPDKEGRRSILDIHTKDWGVSDSFKQSLAENTKGYGGADLRALCTEASLNAIQRSYPQIYSATEKLIVDPAKIDIQASDFMISVKKLIPSSERSAGVGASPLPHGVEPLLRDQLNSIKKALDEMLPRRKKVTALEEAMYEQHEDEDGGFGREALHQEFERTRIFRPRFLISGISGMGQGYLSSALLHYFEGVQIQNFGLPSLLDDGRPMEHVIVSLFTEVKRHKPAVIYIPNIEAWYETVRDNVAFLTFKAMLKTIPPTDPILVLATAEHSDREGVDPMLLKEIFGFSRKNRIEVERPERANRREYFSTICDHIRKSPSDFPDPANRKKRVLEELPVAPPPPPKVPTKEEMKNMQKRDRQLLNILKVQLQPIMDQINRKYKKFRQPVIPTSQLEHLFLESDPNYIRPDIAEAQARPFEIVKDKHGNDVLRETATGKTYYNLETTTIEERLSNGYYCRPDDFLQDIKCLARDARNIGDKERTLKANELVSNVEVDVATIAAQTATTDWEALRQRQIQRSKAAAEKERKRNAMQSIVDRVQSDTAAGNDSDSQGPVVLGERVPGSHVATRFQPMSPPPNGAEPVAGPLGPPKSHGQEDVEMGGVDNGHGSNSQNTNAMKPPSQWPTAEARSADESARATAGNTQLSQRSAITSVPPGVSPSAFVNDASTTKTSDPSDHSSKFSTQITNGYHGNDDTQNEHSLLPDTQVPSGAGHSQNASSDEPWPHSQADALLRDTQHAATESASAGNSNSNVNSGGHSSGGNGGSGRNSNNNNASNSSGADDSLRNSGCSSQEVVIHEGQVENFLEKLTDGTSGCTIEQLEQINRELMSEIWRTKHLWNRMQVLADCTRVFNETISDIEEIQGLLQQSQG